MYKIYKIEFECIPIYIGITKNSIADRASGGWPLIPKDILKQSKIIIIEETDDKTRELYWINKYRDDSYELYNSLLPSSIKRSDYKTNIEYLVDKEMEKKKRQTIKNKLLNEIYHKNKIKKIKKDYKGYSFDKNVNKWKAYIIDGKKRINLGSYDTEEEAKLEHLKAKIEYNKNK